MVGKNGQFLFKNQVYNQEEIQREKEAREAKLKKDTTSFKRKASLKMQS